MPPAFRLLALAPATNTVYTTGSNIILNATASSSNPGGSIAKVDFYQGNFLLGTAIAAPYNFTWTNIANGTYVLTAKATDNNGLTATAASANITVASAPVTSISAPANNTILATGSNITINATASSPNSGGSIAKVDFYQGNTLLGSTAVAPYSFTWTNVANGAYALTAVATDNNGFTSTTAVMNVVVGQCTSPALIPQSQMRVIYFDSQNSTTEAASKVLDGNTSTIWHTQYSPTTASLPHEIQLSLGGVYNVNTFKYLPRQSGTNGMVGQYEIYVSMDSTNWGTPVATGTLPGTASEKVIVFAEKVGKYLRFRATSEAFGNQYTSAAEVNVGGCQQTSPSVSITSPVNGATVAAGSPVSVTAAANSTNTSGSITSVRFYNGSTLVGTAVTAPYSYTLNNTTVLGNDTLTVVATDNYGLIAASSPVVITIKDMTPPAIQTTAGSLDATIQCTDEAGLAAALSRQPVAADIYTANPAIQLIGDTVVTHCGNTYTRTRSWNFTDSEGNVSDTFIQTITVQDTVAPVITGKTDLARSADAGTCTYTVVGNEFDVTATDNCITVTLGYALSGATAGSGNTTLQGISFNKGTTTITWTATDACGNQSAVSFNVTVNDTENPVITAPAAVSASAAPGLCGTAVTLATPATADNCGVQSVTNDAPAFFPVGITIVTWTVTDNSGNTATATQTVTVSDNEAPSITAPASITTNTDTGSDKATVSLGTATASDNCGVQSVTNDAPAQFPLGTTTVTWTVTDIHGNTSTATQTVTVVDAEKPTINAPVNISVANDAGKCSAVVNLGSPVTGDNGGVASVTNDAPAFFPVGTTIVTWTVTDNSGNTSTSTQTVTVTDNESPVVITKPVTVVLANGTAFITVADVNNGSSDNCGIASMSLANNTFTQNDIGSNIVTLTITDIHGNTSSGTATVTVKAENKLSVSITAIPANNTYTGGVPTNIYLGYGPQSVTLKAIATDGAPYTYAWTGNGTLSNTTAEAPVFTPTVAGYYTFTVTVTNIYGYTASSSIGICVRDIRVPGSNNKVYITHNGQTLSISANAVPAHLSNHQGDYLGAADQHPCTAVATNAAVLPGSVISERVGGLSLKVYPNPTASVFKLDVESSSNEKISMQLTDVNGRVLRSMDLTEGRTVQFGNDLPAGSYFLTVKQGTKNKTVKLIKL